MLTQSERRGLSLLVLVFAIGAARDLWTWRQLGRPAPEPTPIGVEAWVLPPADSAAGPAAPSVPGTPSAPGEPVDLNRASAEELDRLPGIGPVLAGRILEHRSRHGPFRDPDELLAVPGIGPRLLERLRPRIRTAARDSGAAARR